VSTSNANKEILATPKPGRARSRHGDAVLGRAAAFRGPCCLSGRGLLGCGVRDADCWTYVVLAAKDINQTSRSLISGRFYTRANPFQMLQQQKCRNFG
jgi:hypothetical protein